MKLISVNVALPRDIIWRGKAVKSSIWKNPVEGRVRVSTLNLDGDQQSDLLVHGGVDKAIYVYPREHYSYWRIQLPEVDLPWGGFGENFTTEGLFEDQVQIGDRLRTGSAEFIVTQPRMPCFKLGIRFDRPGIVKRFLQSKRTGFYLAVLREGEVAGGDPIEFTDRQESGVTIIDIVNLYTLDSENQELIRRATELPTLPGRLERLLSQTPLGRRCVTTRPMSRPTRGFGRRAPKAADAAKLERVAHRNVAKILRDLTREPEE